MVGRVAQSVYRLSYGLDGPGIVSRCWRVFPQLGPTQPPVQWVPGLSQGWRAEGAWRWPLTPFYWSRKSTVIPLLPLWAVRPVQSLTACTVEHYLYSPYWPCGLYRASVPVQDSYTSTPAMGRTACTEPQCLYSRAILPLLLCTVRPVQSLSACTVQLYLYSLYGPYGLYRASVPVQYSYTSTPSMGRTASTEPQCLYSDAPFTFTFFSFYSLWNFNIIKSLKHWNWLFTINWSKIILLLQFSWSQPVCWLYIRGWVKWRL